MKERTRMLLIAGTVPYKDFPLVTGTVEIEGESLKVNGQHFSRTQGTGAMISAALSVTSYLKLPAPQVLLAGDTGEGKGSREIYEYLIEHIDGISPEVLALHYWLPDMSLSRRLCKAIEKCHKRPLMIADAASMYSAKAAGLAKEFDIFTPDATEIAFLADPDATHPAYISRHLFDTDISRTPELVAAAYKNGDAAKLMMVKGATDYVVRDGEILEAIAEPDVPELEAIGGTGDTITGLIAAFVSAGLEPHEAAIIAARTNRTAGKIRETTPATKVAEIIDRFPEVFADNLCEWSGVCVVKGED
jgi:NAD(P)H-hydrate repair Nnr-like enzyme with NAD(P)H-hydrate dehydratase domain